VGGKHRPTRRGHPRPGAQPHHLRSGDAGRHWGTFDPALEAEHKQQEKLYLDSTARWLGAVSPVTICTSLVAGFEAGGILDHIGANRPDLIVMATHGRGAVGRLVLGSIADQLIRQSGVPVLLIHPPAEPRSVQLIPEPAPQNILVPLDGSALAEQILPPATELARLFQSEITLLRVVESDGLAQREKADAEAYLERMAARLLELDVPVRSRVVVGWQAAPVILDEANCNSDLVALATHGRGGLRRMLFGSIADQVVGGTVCPALVYRPAP
jgi:nucleotide-binding universal stress UspA family protein